MNIYKYHCCPNLHISISVRGIQQFSHLLSKWVYNHITIVEQPYNQPLPDFEKKQASILESI